jgi:hypothetical protein
MNKITRFILHMCAEALGNLTSSTSSGSFMPYVVASSTFLPHLLSEGDFDFAFLMTKNDGCSFLKSEQADKFV